MQSAEPETGSEADLARECVYRFMALALTSPYEANWHCLINPDDQRLALEAAALLRDEADFRPDFLGFGELSPDNLDLGTLLTELNRPIDHIKAEYDRVFGLVIPKECPPYETEYHPLRKPFSDPSNSPTSPGFTARSALSRPVRSRNARTTSPSNSSSWRSCS